MYVTDGIISLVHIESWIQGAERQEWRHLLGWKYVVGDVHETDILPLLWRSLDVELTRPNGEKAEISMLRPLWWIQSTGAKEGGVVHLHVEEAGLRGAAKILDLSDDVTADSRHTPQGIVIGKISRENAEVVDLEVDSDQDNLVGVTPNHPLYSADRGKYIRVDEFRTGERIRTSTGTVTVTSITRRISREKVYNLEVHRAQNYFVGPQQLEAHNTGINCDALNIAGSLNAAIERNRIDFLKNLLGDPKTRGAAWDKMGLDDGPIEIWNINGKRFLANGNHRFHAAKELGIPIPHNQVKIIDKGSSPIPTIRLEDLVELP